MVAHQCVETSHFRGESYCFLVDFRAGVQDVSIVYLNLDLISTKDVDSS